MQLLDVFTPLLPEKNTRKLNYPNLLGSSPALVFSRLAQQFSGLILLIAEDNLAATRFEQEIAFFAPGLPVLTFPDWETLPYDQFSPHADIIAQRLTTLYRLPSLSQGILIVPVSTLLQRLLPRSYLRTTTLLLAQGDKLNLNDFRKQLEQSGYRCVSQVMEHGEFAIRGSLLDLYPSSSELPLRIDLFDDEIDSIRTFDPDTQRTQEVISQLHLLPAREFPLTETAITHFRQSWREKFAGNPTLSPIYQDVSQGFCPPGVEYYFPLFFESIETLFDYLPQNTLVVRDRQTAASSERFWKELQERYEQVRHDVTRPILAPNELYLSVEELFATINQFVQVQWDDNQAAEEEVKKYAYAVQALPDLRATNQTEQPLRNLKNFLTAETSSLQRVLFTAESLGRREVLLELLRSIEIQPALFDSWQAFLSGKEPLGIAVAPLEAGMKLTQPGLIIIPEAQLLGQTIVRKRYGKARQFDGEAVVKNLAELSVGTPVVHIDHGVGRYVGLQTLTFGELTNEFLLLEYANQDKLYVPVASLHLISRYSGMDLEHAPLNRLGTDQWEKAQRKAAEQVCDVAAELLDVYARRAARAGFSFKKPDADYWTFAAAFPFETTLDQQRAIEQVLQDMITPRPMDRLICGDVGFGKTEVAMRAAFLAVQTGKQVAILVPTTLLAQQHYQNFKDRFANWPVQIEMLSRFRSAKEQKQVLEKLQTGVVDIVIGTHKIIQGNIQFKNLGLVIIDEEHRFGVQQKEKLKALRSEVDVLALTATPIPRTLNMALSGLRELSIIATPPARRLAIKTFVSERSPRLIREAVLRELMRGGQVYFLHNEVQTIERVAQELRELIPEASVNIAHGQMHERELERVMSDFYHHRFNVLVCTTIIETGIDVPTANTIIMDRADKLGLAQLHQLRGRVGRSHHQAYAYLITPPKKTMTADAVKRLDAIASLEDLGAGFTLATHDLEIRGAGELLGEDQSGNVQAIGFSLYMELLEQAIAALKSGKQPVLDQPLHRGTEIDLQITALIPENYIPDVHTRLILYKRIASAPDNKALQELQVEMIDRFGLLPQAVKNLFAITELKLKAQKLGIRKIDASAKGGRLDFNEKPNIDPMTIIRLIQKHPQTYRFDGAQRLRFIWDETPSEARIAKVSGLLDALG